MHAVLKKGWSSLESSKIALLKKVTLPLHQHATSEY